MEDLREKIAHVVFTQTGGNDVDASGRAADAILALLRESVKPLEWLELNDPIGSPEPYQIWRDNGGSGAPDDPLEVFDGFMLYSPHMAAMGVYSSIGEAKAAAQADYNRRILSALGIDQ